MGKASQKPPTFMTADEFLAWDGDGTSTRYELVDGVVRAMAPAAVNHGLIHAQLVYLLKRHVANGKLPCAVVDAPGIRPKANSNANVRIPEIAITCSKLEAGLKTLPEPLVLVEILSPSNRADTWSNVWTYLTIPSLQEVLIVESTKKDVKLLGRLPDGTWPEVPETISQLLRLKSLNFTTTVAEIYEGAPVR